MTPEEIEELRALACRLSDTTYGGNMAVILGAALEHIDQQAARIKDLEEALVEGRIARRGILRRDYGEGQGRCPRSACREVPGGLQMTLAALLVELEAVDAKTYDDISHLELIGWQQPRNQAMDHLQGCIQRACERRGWTWRVFRQTPANEKSHCGEIGEIAPGYEGDCYEQYHEFCIASVEGDSPAEALLAAYVAAAARLP